jgi:hypothetical protein
MWRGSINNDNKRILDFKKNYNKIQNSFKIVKKKYNIKKIYLFPYTKKFLNECINLNCFDGFVVYRNPKEKDYNEIIKKNKKKNFLIIRPFRNSKKNIKSLINYSINVKNIKGIIFSCSSLKQFNQILSYAK